MNRKFTVYCILALSLGLAACNLPDESPQQPLAVNLKEQELKQFTEEVNHQLDLEYSQFSTQAMTQEHLTDRLKHWQEQNKGHQTSIEIYRAFIRDPKLLTIVLQSDSALFDSIIVIDEVQARMGVNVDFQDFMLALSGGPEPIGEFQVNTSTETASLFKNNVAMNDLGDFVVVWYNTSQQAVKGRCFDGTGQATSDEFQVNSYTTPITGAQIFPDVDINAEGQFIVVWSGKSPENDTNASIQARRFNIDCTPQDSSQFQINSYTTGTQDRPAVALDDTGNFTVVWEGGAGTRERLVYARRFTDSGTTGQSEFLVNQYTNVRSNWADIAMDDEGDFVISWWNDDYDDASIRKIIFRRYDKDGNALSDDTVVNTITDKARWVPRIGMDDDGDFVITWNDLRGVPEIYEVHARRYNKNGVSPDAQEFKVNTYTTADQKGSSIGMDSEGNFIITWMSYGQDGDYYGIYAQRYLQDGSADGSEFRINTTTIGKQARPVIAMNSSGHYIVTWFSGPNAQGDQIMAGNRLE